jgi:hypothetical protein
MIETRSTLVLPADLHRQVRDHLFPGDGLEAAALLLCSTVPGARQKLIAKEVVLVPHAQCVVRERDRLTWPGESVEEAIDRAEKTNASIVAIHSHPGELFDFSRMDDTSDAVLMRSIHEAIDRPHGSAIMVPSGAVRARLYFIGQRGADVDLVTVPGSDILMWWSADATEHGPAQRPMAFTADMTTLTERLSAVVIGASGTGSITAEQVGRLGFGEVIPIDFDKIERKNLNRILNATLADAERETLKVDVVERSIKSYRPNTRVRKVPLDISTREAVLMAAQADVIFCCVDSAEGRHFADRIAAAMAIPLFDVGVTIPTRKTPNGGRAIAEVCGRIDYVRPGGPTLKDRGVYDAAALEAEYLARVDPEAHRRKLVEGYIQGRPEEAPAVISLNMRASADCMLEFIARAFPYRHDPNSRFVRTIFMLADGDIERFPETDFEISNEYVVGDCDSEPLLGLPALAAPRTPR